MINGNKNIVTMLVVFFSQRVQSTKVNWFPILDIFDFTKKLIFENNT